MVITYQPLPGVPPSLFVAVAGPGTGAPERPRDAGEPPRRDRSSDLAVDALQQRSLEHLRTFTDWLERGDAVGWIGEVGWPADDPRWNELADRWYREAGAHDLWVTAWATGEWWGPYELSIFTTDTPGSPLDGVAPQASVLAAHPGGPGPDRGVNVNGGEFGIGCNLGIDSGCAFSNRRPGRHGIDYKFPSRATLAFLASNGVELIRLPFRWERVQPVLHGSLDVDEVGRIREVLADAQAAGVRVIPVPMNYGAYWRGDDAGRGIRQPIGSEAVPVRAFTDLWRRLVVAFGAEPAVLGWGLMNEPIDVPGDGPAWEEVSQAAVDAIRKTGDARTILVPGYLWSTVQWFPDAHPDGPWIDDPLDDIRYEAHQYFDADLAGEYRTYAEELRSATS